MRWVLSLWHLLVRLRPRFCRREGLLFQCFIFCVFSKSQSFYHFELRNRTDDIYVCICIYVRVIYHKPVARFYCVHNSHCHYHCVHNNVLQHVLSMYAIMFYCNLSEITIIKMINRSYLRITNLFHSVCLASKAVFQSRPNWRSQSRNKWC